MYDFIFLFTSFGVSVHFLRVRACLPLQTSLKVWHYCTYDLLLPVYICLLPFEINYLLTIVTCSVGLQIQLDDDCNDHGLSAPELISV